MGVLGAAITALLGTERATLTGRSVPRQLRSWAVFPGRRTTVLAVTTRRARPDDNPDDGAETADAPPVSRWLHVPRLACSPPSCSRCSIVAVSRVVDGLVRRRRRHRDRWHRWPHLLVAAVLAAVFVPGHCWQPVAASARPLVGTFVTLGSTVTTAMITALVGRHAGRESARHSSVRGRAHRRPDPAPRAVGGRRPALHPGIRRPISYAFGAFGMPLRQMAIGAFIGLRGPSSTLRLGA